MDLAQLTVRDWMVIAGVLLILAVLLDAFRRVHNERNSPARLKPAATEPNKQQAREVDLAWLKELPNGGARVVTRADMSFDEISESGEAPSDSATQDDQVEIITGMNAGDDAHNIDWLDQLDEQGGHPQGEAASPPREAPRLPRAPDPEVFMLNVVAREPAGFNGGDILHILLACDLRFGDMSFFHRYEQEAGRGPIQFSVANMMQPGVFDIDNMSDITTPGLVFFLTLPGPENMMQAFDYMFETAQAVARNLEGDVLDETRSVMTKQVAEHSRQKIVDLERRMLAQAEC